MNIALCDWVGGLFQRRVTKHSRAHFEKNSVDLSRLFSDCIVKKLCNLVSIHGLIGAMQVQYPFKKEYIVLHEFSDPYAICDVRKFAQNTRNKVSSGLLPCIARFYA